LETPEGWVGGLRKKSLLWGRYRYFLELHIPVKDYIPFHDCHDDEDDEKSILDRNHSKLSIFINLGYITCYYLHSKTKTC